MSLIPLPDTLIPFLESYLPVPKENSPFVTLTWAQSLDSRIASHQGTQTKISHPETKTMTHYLRAYHDAILVGVGTVLADDPKLNCRYGNFSKIRPVIIDPHGKWNYSQSTLCKIREEGKGLAPIIFIDEGVEPDIEDVKILNAQSGGFIRLQFDSINRVKNWSVILDSLREADISSVMVEGGATIINDLLETNLVDSLVITIGPVFLGKSGVEVSPGSHVDLKDMKWWKGHTDCVMAARLNN